jgi:5-methylthioadenosine/S-adenosylhomocysteine deaminase
MSHLTPGQATHGPARSTAPTQTTLFSRRTMLYRDDPAGAVAAVELRPARVTVRDGHIAAVQEASAPEPGDDDLGEHLLTPAFVDVHTHLALVSLRGVDPAGAGESNLVEDFFFRFERKLTADDARALARVSAQECLLAGTAFVSDHYYFGAAVAEAMADVGLSGIMAPTLQDLDGPGCGRVEPSLADTWQIAHDDRLRALGIHAALGPHATDTVSDDLWRRVADLAERWSLPVHAHVAQSAAEVGRVQARAGCSPITLLHRLGALDAGPAWAMVHVLYATDDDLQHVDPRRHLLVACPSSQAWFGFPSPVHRWEQARLRWAVATDCSASNDSMTLPKELRALALLRVGALSRSPALRSWERGRADDVGAVVSARSRALRGDDAIDDPARLLARITAVPGALHPDAPVGRIAPGQLANLALWDTSHPALWPGSDPTRGLALCDATGALLQLMVAGRWRSERGRHHELAWGDDWREQRKEAQERLGWLLR